MLDLKINADEKTQFKFDVTISGTNKIPEIFFLIRLNDLDLNIRGEYFNGHILLDIPVLSQYITEEKKYKCILYLKFEDKIIEQLSDEIHIKLPIRTEIKQVKDMDDSNIKVESFGVSVSVPKETSKKSQAKKLNEKVADTFTSILKSNI
jgi:hypothetical protein